MVEPWLEFGAIYDENYYRGKGADPLTDYVDEVANRERTIRQHEWRGILSVVRSLTDLTQTSSWLDFGCGAGGLVQYLRDEGISGAVGFEQSWSLDRLIGRGVAVLEESELDTRIGAFDVITAIEVIEHMADPVTELKRMRALLKPGGILFLTTGNARPYRGKINQWRYVIPEIHISLFEPSTLGVALEKAGFDPIFPGWGPGWAEIVRFKVLKNLRRKYIGRGEALVPWSVLTRLADARWGFSDHPIGRVPVEDRC